MRQYVSHPDCRATPDRIIALGNVNLTGGDVWGVQQSVSENGDGLRSLRAAPELARIPVPSGVQFPRAGEEAT